MNPKNRYSGGRMLAIWMAYACAANGYDVDFYTNCIPKFIVDYPHDESFERLHFKLNSNYLWRAKNHDYKMIMIVPHLASRKSPIYDRFLFYPFARRLKKNNKCPLWYLDFECYGWIKSVDPELRPAEGYRYSDKILPYCDMTLSISGTGLIKAKEYYPLFNPNIDCKMVYSFVNMFAAEGCQYKNKEDLAVFIARFGQKHKNNESVFNMIDSLPSNFEFAIMGNKEGADPLFISEIERRAKERHLELVFYKNITDKEKYNLFGKAKIMFFPSKFEGFGLPPMEAQYMGASVICSDIPVLKEISPMATFVDFEKKDDVKNAVNQLLEHPQDADVLRNYIVNNFSPKKFV